MTACEDVEKWKKRLRRKGPFYLLGTETQTEDLYDHTVTPSLKSTVPATLYWVIWNDGEKTKMAAFKDYMWCRYGAQGTVVLNGDTPFDLWNGAGLEQETFDEMLGVRKGTTALSEFDLDTLVGVRW